MRAFPWMLALAVGAHAEPLMLTPLIRAGKLQEARDLSKVVVDGGDMGHAGYFSVPSASANNTNNFFLWFQPCTEGCDPATAPLVQWMQGGPGAPSTFGALAEIGNWYIDETMKAKSHCFSWCRTRNCLFVDSPTMTGFSFQVNATGQFDKQHIEYTQTSQDAGKQLYGVLQQFLTVFPEYQPAPYWVTGESYGGIYVPWLAKTVVEGNKASPKIKVNIKGISVGDPVMDARAQWPTYATTLHAMGLLMEEERDQMEAIFKKGVDLLSTSCYGAFEQWNRIWMDDGGSSCSPNCDFFYKNLTGSPFTENVLLGKNPESLNYFGTYLQAHDKEFHFSGIPASQLNEGGDIYLTMVKSGDFCQSSSKLYTELFLQAGLEVNIYSSTQDPLLGPPTTEAGIKAAWTYAKENIPGAGKAMAGYYSAKKVVWSVAKEDGPAGYSKCYTSLNRNRFCYTIVRNAGHMTPSFMPRSSYDMTERFLGGHPFDGTWFDSKLPQCAQCGGTIPLAGSALPACANTAYGKSDLAMVV